MTTKNKVTHTAGPWYVSEPSNETSSDWSVCKKGDRSICSMNGRAWYGNSPTALENEANARLIAAAPELLEALKNLLACNPLGFRLDDPRHAVYDQAKAVISKAEGDL